MNPATDLWSCGHASKRRAEIVFRPSESLVIRLCSFSTMNSTLSYSGEGEGTENSVRAIVTLKELFFYIIKLIYWRVSENVQKSIRLVIRYSRLL